GALLQDGSVCCWGSNVVGQLGDGTTQTSATPVRVPGISTATNVTASWWHHTCALLADASIRCWGENTWGQLGDGTTTTTSTPVTMSGTSITWTTSNPAIAIIDATGRATAVDSGIATITAVDSSGTTSATTMTVPQRVLLGLAR